MSISSIIHGLKRTTRKTETSLLEGVRAFFFWSAIVLPFLYIPLLAVGLDTVTRSVVFLALLSLNIVALLSSHSYRPN